ncbi:hypothetical protein KKG83_07975 [Candidatus Micrarchaeota archaeon]|nr:hypothetical protein [Candidatus Micrarchaeota archaeon]
MSFDEEIKAFQTLKDDLSKEKGEFNDALEEFLSQRGKAAKKKLIKIAERLNITYDVAVEIRTMITNGINSGQKGYPHKTNLEIRDILDELHKIKKEKTSFEKARKTSFLLKNKGTFKRNVTATTKRLSRKLGVRWGIKRIRLLK